MILQIRTKDNLDDLLRHGTSPSWVISEEKIKSIEKVETFQFEGKKVLKADFKADLSRRTESGRLIVAFSNGIIENSEHKWIGQNPIKYNIDELSVSEKIEEKWIDIDWTAAQSLVLEINPEAYEKISDFFEDREKETVSASKFFDEETTTIRINSKFPKADETSNYYFDVGSTGLEFFFSNQGTVIYIEVLNEFDDFDDYFESDYDHGSTIARLLWKDYIESFREIRDNGDDDRGLDEDYMNFQECFVNYILNTESFD